MNHALSSDDPGTGRRQTRKILAVSILSVVALGHLFRLGSFLSGQLFTLYYSYFSDIVVPFGMYFLFILAEDRATFLRDWRVKSLLVFGAASCSEIMQAFGVPLFGRTFDPLDFIMFGGGVVLAVVVDRRLIAYLSDI